MGGAAWTFISSFHLPVCLCFKSVSRSDLLLFCLLYYLKKASSSKTQGNTGAEKDDTTGDREDAARSGKAQSQVV